MDDPFGRYYAMVECFKDNDFNDKAILVDNSNLEQGVWSQVARTPAFQMTWSQA